MNNEEIRNELYELEKDFRWLKEKLNDLSEIINFSIKKTEYLQTRIEE